VSVGWLFLKGIGIWGINVPVAWGWDIVNFVWWVGNRARRHADLGGLLLLRQQWRTSINRFAEAMTIFAVRPCAGQYPILHLGRPWLFFWLLPYPSSMGTCRSSEVRSFGTSSPWSTYATTVALFWYVGLVPDLATLRDSAKSKVAKVLYVLRTQWVGAIGGALAQLRVGVPAPRGIGDAARALGPLGGELRLRGRCGNPAGTPRSFRPTSLAGAVSRASRWFSRSRSRCARCSTSKTSSPFGTWRTWRR